MTDHQDRINEGVIDALEAANSRIDQLEQQLAEERAQLQAQSLTPEQRAEADRQTHGEVVREAIVKANRRKS